MVHLNLAFRLTEGDRGLKDEGGLTRMWLSEHDSLRRQIKRLDHELKTLRKERQQLEAAGCYSDRELAAKEAAMDDYDRRIQILEIERERLQFMHQTGGSHDVQAES